MTNKQTIEHHSNGNGNGKHKGAAQLKDIVTVWEPKPQPAAQTATPFKPDDQPVILERPSWWSHAFVWMIVSVTGFALLWAGFAPIDQSIPAQGKLEAEGAAKELRAPNGGVVRDILVKDGDRVKKGDLLVILDSLAPQADLDSLLKQRETLLRENQFYNTQFNGNISLASPEFQELIKLKAALQSENQYYQALLNQPSRIQQAGSDEFSTNQQGLLAASRAEYRSRVEAARLQIQELQKQVSSVATQLAAAEAQVPMQQQQLQNARDRMAAAQKQLETAKEQLPMAANRVSTAQELLASDQALLDKIKPVVEAGALSELQSRRQQQQVLTRKNELVSSQAEILSRREQISAILGEIAERQAEMTQRQTELLRTKAEADRFKAEQERLQVEINRAKEQVQNAIALSEKDNRTKIGDNHKRIAEIDSQLARLRLENKKRLDEIESQISKAKQAVQFQEMRAPVDGVVFNLKPTGPGYVVRQIDSEPVLTVVPEQNLVAKVYLTNRDIGQIVDRLKRENELNVEVNVESLPSTEFGTLQGKLKNIGSDVLPPTQERPYYSFPATIELTNQTLKVGEKDIRLQAGMAVNASVKVRRRTVLSIFTELFQKQVDSLETVR